MARTEVIVSGIASAMLVAALLTTPRGVVAQTSQTCTSGSLTSEQQMRRRQAVQLARAINTAEARARAFIPIARLTDIVIPDGFAVQLLGSSIQQTDTDSGYIFTVKDTHDACNRALFSDQSGLIYLAEPLR